MIPGQWRAWLRPLGWGFGAVSVMRNRAFDRGLLGTHHVGAPVISVGNLVAGGTGKTPFVEYLIKHMSGRVPKLAMVSRGYGRRSRGVVVVSDGSGGVLGAAIGGDEPVQVARKFPGVAVVVGEDRVAAARVAVEDIGAGLVILDDGYQHRYLHRDCDILLLDARRNIAREPMLPAGNRRELLCGIARADLVVFTRVESLAAGVPWEDDVQQWVRGPRAFSQMATAEVVRAADGQAVELSPEQPIFAFSGIADHAGFVAAVRAAGIQVVGERAFADHHRYTRADLESLSHACGRSGAAALLTTEKDMMRLMDDDPGGALGGRPLYFVRIELTILKGEGEILETLNRTLRRSAA